MPAVDRQDGSLERYERHGWGDVSLLKSNSTRPNKSDAPLKPRCPSSQTPFDMDKMDFKLMAFAISTVNHMLLSHMLPSTVMLLACKDHHSNWHNTHTSHVALERLVYSSAERIEKDCHAPMCCPVVSS